MRKVIKYLLFNILYPVLLLVSFDKILRASGSNRRLIIMYHGVSKKEQHHINGRHLSAQQFEKHLKYLRRNFNVISLDEICKMKINNVNPNIHTVALTFDDGFLNNLKVALPLLEKYQISATFFTCSINLQDRNYIHPADHLDMIRAKKNISVKIGEEIFVKNKHALVRKTDGTTAIQYINSLSFDAWKAALSNLSKSYKIAELTKDVDDEAYKLLDAQGLKKLSLSQVASIGSHCHSHINVTRLKAHEMIEQLTLSKSELEKLIEKPVCALAFPYGYYHREAIELSKITGYNYLIAGGHVEKEFEGEVFPRIGVLGAGSYARNILSINKGFKRFGF